MRKQLDPRIPILINNNVKKNHRSFIVLVGDRGKDQVRDSISLGLSSIDVSIGCEPALLAFASPCLRPTLSTMVLQKGPWVHNVGHVSHITVRVFLTLH